MKRKCHPLAGNQVACRPSPSLPITLLGAFFLLLLTLPSSGLHAQPVPILAQGPDDLSIQVPDGGFETPDVSGSQQNPTGSAWTFTGITGLSDNGSSITSANPNAPEGQQVAYISRTGDIATNLDLPTGYHTFTFQAAQSGLNPAGDQSLELLVDGQAVQTFTPNNTNYQTLTSKVLYLDGGNHSIALKGKTRNATALIDDFQHTWTRFKNALPIVSGPPYVYQLLYLFPNGQANVNLNIEGDGHYRVVFNATKSGGAVPDLRLKIGGEEVGEFKVKAGSAPDTTLCLFLNTGSHTLNLKNLSSTTSIQVNQINIEHIGDWHDPYTWVGGQIPGNTDFALVPADVSVALNGSMTPEFLTANGELLAPQNQDLDITTKHILADGSGALIEVGREHTPYPGTATFTLNATIQDTITFNLPMGSKFIAAKSGARWEMHGLPRKSWTRLSATALASDQSISLTDSVDWGPGDSIVIASTDYNPHLAEALEVATVSSDGKTLTLSAPLAYMHYGRIDSFSNGVRWFEMDERAEVGLLSHNILIQGNTASEASRYGAHTMSMAGATSHISNVEFFLAGQAGILGKYPFHWHKAQNVKGQYIRNCGIHRSYNRAVTVHSTDSALVEGVVGYDHFGHGFFLEAGDEEGNTFLNNLGLITRVPKGFKAVEPHDSVPAEEGGGLFKLPATFWITNPSNNFIGNAAAGSEGAGFWMVALSQPLEGTTAGPPAFLPLGTFTDNVAHSASWSNFSIDGGIDKNTHEFINGTYAPKVNGQPIVPTIERLTCYRSIRRGVWIRAHSMIFEDCAFAEMPIMTLFAFNQRLNNSLLMGQSPQNIGNPMTGFELQAGRSLPRPNQQPLGAGNRIYGYNIYDGPAEYFSVHFAGFDFPNTWCMQPVGAATKSTVHRAMDLSFDPLIPVTNQFEFTKNTTDDHIYSTGLIDLDGSLTDTAGMRITPRIIDPMNPARFWQIYEDGFNTEPTASYKPEWNAWFGDEEHFALHRMENAWPEGTGASMYAYRTDGPALLTPAPKGKNNQNAVIVNKNSQFQYRWQYHRICNQIKTFIRFCNQNDELVSRIENVPSTTRVTYGGGSSPALASNITDLVNSSTEKYLIKDNTLYIKHVATDGGTDPQYGDLYSYRSPVIFVCQNNNCSNPTGRTDFATLADFEIGVDDRFAPGGTYSISGLTFDAPQDPFAGGDNSMAWSIQTDGNGVDDYVDIRMALPRTVISEFRTLQLNYSGDDMIVLLHDIDQGEYILDTVQAGTAVNISLSGAVDPTDWTHFDQVDSIIFRIPESFLGSLNGIHQANFSVKEMRLYDQVQTGGSKMGNGESAMAFQSVLEVSPNPSTGHFHLRRSFMQPQSISLRVLDLQGAVLMERNEQVGEGEWESTLDLPTAGFPNGIYLLQVASESGVETLKLSLQR